MSIFKRMRDISVATLNDMLEQSEDPVRLIDKYLTEQREQIVENERLYRQCLTHAQSLRQQYVQAEEMKQRREQQALMALKAQEEELARLAVHEKIHFEEKSTRYKKLYEDVQESIIELEDQLQQLKSDYQEIADRRSYYLARLESLRLQKRMNERLGESAGSVGDRAFTRLEDKVADLELETKSLRDVRKMTEERLQRAGDSVKRTVEQEMEMLRSKLERREWKS